MTGTVTANEVSGFLDNTVAGGAITAFNSVGAPVNVQFRWAKVDSAVNGGTDTWNLFYLEDSFASGTDVAWRNTGVDYTFGADGSLQTPAGGSITIPNLTVDGVVLPSVTVDHGTTGLTQFADGTGAVRVTEIDQDGFAAGQLNGVSISDAGRIVGIYSNGEALELGELAIATFNADEFPAEAGRRRVRADPGIRRGAAWVARQSDRAIARRLELGHCRRVLQADRYTTGLHRCHKDCDDGR